MEETIKQKIKDTKAQTHTPSAMRHKIKDEVLEEHFKRWGIKSTDLVPDAINLAISKTIEWKDKEIGDLKDALDDAAELNDELNTKNKAQARAIFEDDMELLKKWSPLLPKKYLAKRKELRKKWCEK